jgi:hypothetical protein
VAKGPWGTESFVEGFGVGLFAETMVELESGEMELPSEKPERVIPAVMKILNEQVDHFPAKNMVGSARWERCLGESTSCSKH